MFNVDVPRYFCLDFIDTKPIFETQNQTNFNGRPKLTDLEKEHDKRLADFAFQLELTKNLNTREVAQLFIDYGDVTVVKVTHFTYWVDFESFDSEEV